MCSPGNACKPLWLDTQSEGHTGRKTVLVCQMDQRIHVQVKRGYIRLQTHRRTDGWMDKPEHIMPLAAKSGGILTVMCITGNCALDTGSPPDANFFITGNISSCHYDNLWCDQCWRSCHQDNYHVCGMMRYTKIPFQLMTKINDNDNEWQWNIFYCHEVT